MRVTVGMIVGMIAADHSIEEILQLYPYLERRRCRAGSSICGLAKRGKRSNPSDRVKLLLDMNLSPVWARILQDLTDHLASTCNCSLKSHSIVFRPAFVVIALLFGT
jgi:hypothetical protein